MKQIRNFCVGEWLEEDLDNYRMYIERISAEIGENYVIKHPSVRRLKNLIETDTVLYMGFTKMIDQVPPLLKHRNPTGGPQIRDVDQMLYLIDYSISSPPSWNDSELVGFPINAILNWSMSTPAGMAIFLDKRVNARFKDILNEWGRFLTTPESRSVLTSDPGGWFSEDALDHLAVKGFPQDFVCDPQEEYYGFTSWDDFFTREFKQGVRPIGDCEDTKIPIVNACESAPFSIQRNVQRRSKFWIKSQPYSLYDMLTNTNLEGSVYDYIDYFVGGTVYQAFLSATSYHRWHSPIDGTITHVELIDGTYYAARMKSYDDNPDDFDKGAPNNSQGYLSSVATRAAVYIESDDPTLGVMVALFIGMAEVSSNEVTVSVGQTVRRGDQLGMFHFGGSTHCLIFRGGVEIDFDPNIHPSLNADNIPINSLIATVLKKES